MMMQMRPAADSYTYDVGVASASDIQTKAADIFSRFGYRVVRNDHPRRAFIESQWQSRPPVDEEERARGSDIISRVTVAGSPRKTAESPVMYQVRLTVENRFVPLRGTTRQRPDLTSSTAHARSILKQVSVAFGGTARPVADEPRPF